VNLSIHIELNHSEPEVQNNFIMLVYCSHCVYNLFIRAGNGGRWSASVTYLTLPMSQNLAAQNDTQTSLHKAAYSISAAKVVLTD